MCVAVAFRLSLVAGPRQRRWLDHANVRVKLTSEVIASIRAIKMSGAIQYVRSRMLKERSREISLSIRYRAMLIIVIGICESASYEFSTSANANRKLAAYATALLSPAIGLGIHSVLEVQSRESAVTAAEAFNALSLLTLVASFLSQCIESLMSFFNMLNSMQYIQSFLNSGIRRGQRQHLESPDNTAACNLRTFSLSLTVDRSQAAFTSSFAFENVCARWDVDAPWALSKISFRVKAGQSLAVFGQTACGKSTLLQAILGEVPCITGHITIDRSASIAYCSQEPWLLSGSIRDNVVGPSSDNFDPIRYTNALQASGLISDLAQLVSGDEILCENNGINLSGGQRARVVSQGLTLPQTVVMMSNS